MADDMMDGPHEELEDAEDQLKDFVPDEEDQDADPDDELEELEISETEAEPEFFENLAEVIPENKLKSVATELIERIESDRKAREQRDKQYEEGLKRTGLGNDAPGGADFPGASRVVHPILIEACIDFCARVMKEVFPPDGPVRDKIVGNQTQAKLEKAKRKVRHMNWQLTVECKEFRPELEQTLTQTPMGGDCYMKVWWDQVQKRPRFMMVPVDKMILPFAASSFRTAERRTHILDVTQAEVEADIRRGMYRDVELTAASMLPDPTKAMEANDKIEGKEPTGDNRDGIRRLFEVMLPMGNFKCDGFEDPYVTDEDGFAPYIITIDEQTQEVLSVYRNWDPEDNAMTELENFVDYVFLPWRGAYALGLPHIIGTLSGATTGALRALLDSAHIQNAPTALKLADPTTGGGQTVTAKATQVSEIGAGMGIDDIRKLAMPMPFNPPSSTLFQLLTFLVGEARGVIRTTYQEIADSGATPVGTTMARMEQAMVVFSSICGRIHQSQADLFRILHRLNKQNLSDYVTLEDTGEVLAYRSDYDGPIDVVPVSDPNIFSEAQRQAQAISVVQRATGNPMYDQREVEKLFLRAMKVQDPDRFLVKQPQPERMNPVNENVAATFGRPLAAFPDQDHLAHIQVHLDYMTSPVLGSMPNLMPTVIAGMVEHLKQHVAFWYVSQTYDMVKKALGVEPTEVMVDDPETQAMFDRLLAVSSHRVLQMADQQLAGLPPIIQKAMQTLQSMQPPPPMDPSAVQAMEVQRKQADDQARNQNEQKRLEQKDRDLNLRAAEVSTSARRDDMKTQIQAENDRAKLQQDGALGIAKIESATAIAQAANETKQVIASQSDATKERMNMQDNATAMTIAGAEIESSEIVDLSTGTGINPGPND